jgi:hypothetical protein
VSRRRLDPDALPIVLRQRLVRKLLALGLTLLVGVVVLAGGALVASGLTEGDPWTVLAGIALLGLTLPLWLYWVLQVLPGSCSLRVTTAGFSTRHCFLSRDRRWDEVGRFYARTYSTPRIGDYETVAFTGEEGRVVGLGAFLDDLRLRGVAESDILPDTYGYSAVDLAEFLNACSERYGERSPDHIPRTIAVTRGYLIGVSIVLISVIGGLLAWAVAGAIAGEPGTAALAVLLAAPFAFALAHGWIRWRRGTLRRGARLRGPVEGA